jgi:hypothetical protein
LNSSAVAVADRSSNKPENIVSAAEVIGRSSHKARVFAAIYRGKKLRKTVRELMRVTRLPQRRVLDAGRALVDHDIVLQARVEGRIAYEKIPFYQRVRDKVLAAAASPTKRKSIVTKRTSAEPRTSSRVVHVRVTSRPLQRAEFLSIDEIDSFRRVRTQSHSMQNTRMPEAVFKQGLANILEDRGRFKDFGGELRDLFSSRLLIGGKRHLAAFAFKGPGQKGLLTPGKMGKNGDQIQRLVSCPADIFVVQYWAQIGDGVVDQLKQLVLLKAAVFERRRLYYCVIDGQDSSRLIAAYPEEFS